MKTIICARCGVQVLEVVPYNFCWDLPIFLSEEFAHWMDLKTGEIEFRPLCKTLEICAEQLEAGLLVYIVDA